MRPFIAAAITAGLALTLTACNGSKPSASNSPSSTPSSTPATTPTPSTPPSSSTPVVTPSPAPKVRTKAELTKALLALADLPPGLAIDPDNSDDGSRLSWSNSRCKTLVTLFNAQTPPGAKASVTRLFSGGQQGPFVEEDLAAMASPAEVTKLLATTKAAIRACHQVKLTIPGEGTSPMQVAEVSAPAAGTTPVAVRFSATSGPLEGLEVTFAVTGLDDVVLAVNVDDPSGLEGATTAAAEKAQKVLGTAKAGA
ncbi:hypothetical protein AB0E69_04710 [Kribbella sp. NPDC026611]|uniref:hypothetical protein n=1 Tax=Kribbella sp. NPDC026611 TaxID=3154911 RepID=UPI0033E3687F